MSGRDAADPLGDGQSTPIDPCDPPTLDDTSALCVEVSAESILPEADPRFDGRGTLHVELYDRRRLTDGAVLLASRELGGPDGGELSIDSLPHVRLEAKLPGIVFMRVLFADNPASSSKDLVFGGWLDEASIELGVTGAVPLRRVELIRGGGRTVSSTLTPVRKLDVEVTASVDPAENGEGPLGIWVLSSPDPLGGARALGHASSECVSLFPVGQQATLSVPFVGSGPMWVAGVLYDLSGSADTIPPGALTNATTGDGGLPAVSHRIDVPTDSYVATTAIDLSTVVPMDGDGGAGAPSSCSDTAPVTDAGPVMPDGSAGDASSP